MLGVFAFSYVLLHFLTWLILDQGLYWQGILPDIAKRPFITIGFTALLLLIPLAVTSTNGMMRRLGKRWKTLHRLIYVIVPLGVWHYWWQVKADIREPLIYATIVAVLLGWRVWKKKRTSGVTAVERKERIERIRKKKLSFCFFLRSMRSLRLLPSPLYIDVRTVHNSGKNRSSSALARYDTPPVPPVPRL